MNDYNILQHLAANAAVGLCADRLTIAAALRAARPDLAPAIVVLSLYTHFDYWVTLDLINYGDQQ